VSQLLTDHSAWYTWLKSSGSLVSYATNEISFGLLSYDQFGESCTYCLVVVRELQKTQQMLHEHDLSPTIISARFHTYQGGMFLVYIYHALHHLKKGLIKVFLEQPHGTFFTIACEFMEGSLSTPCVASSF
jgi:hypothetical protein